VVRPRILTPVRFLWSLLSSVEALADSPANTNSHAVFLRRLEARGFANAQRVHRLGGDLI